TALGGRRITKKKSRDDGGVVQPRRGLGLAAEAGQERRVAGEVGAQHLDRHGASEPGVMAGMDLGHSAAADQPTDLVSPAQQTRCGVHYLPFLCLSSSLLPGPLLSRRGTGGATAGGSTTTVALVLGVAPVLGVALGEGVTVPVPAPAPAPPPLSDRAKTARIPSTVAAAAPRSQAPRRPDRSPRLPGGLFVTAWAGIAWVGSVWVGIARVGSVWAGIACAGIVWVGAGTASPGAAR